MAGLGIGPAEFAIFLIPDPDQRAAALDGALAPALRRVADGLVGGLSRMTAASLLLHPGRASRRRGGEPADELFVAFCAGDRGYRALPYLALAASRSQLHARIGARPAADRDGSMRRTLLREAGNLARKGKPFRKLRSYADWDLVELPEIAPAHSVAFWEELAESLAPGRNGGCGLDVGIAWSAEEARSLALGDVLGAFRDLAPLFKLLANARA